MKFVIENKSDGTFVRVLGAMEGWIWEKSIKKASEWDYEDAAKRFIAANVLDFACKVVLLDLANESENWIYETKCRRCGDLAEFYFAQKSKVSRPQFLETMNDYIKFPRMRYCQHCGKQTIQELVSHN